MRNRGIKCMVMMMVVDKRNEEEAEEGKKAKM